MNSEQTLQLLHADAPEIVRALRTLFDERLLDLHTVARSEHAVQANGNSPTVHVDFPAGPLQVTAVYHAEEDRFTQLIARAADEAHYERPSFTISLFL
jgi:hypothetical protein